MTNKALSVSFVALLSASPSFAQSGPPAGIAGNVTVVNPASNPANVTVTNPATNPAIIRDNDNPARHTFTQNCNGIGGCQIKTDAGVETVIEAISVDIGSSGGSQSCIVQLEFSSNNFPYFLNPIPPLPSGTPLGSESLFVSSQALRLYADPATTIQITPTIPGAPQTQTIVVLNASVSGYTVKLP